MKHALKICLADFDTNAEIFDEEQLQNWMTTSDLSYVLHAAFGRTMDMPGLHPPTAYDKSVTLMKTQLAKFKATGEVSGYNGWNITIINTDHSRLSGTHWVVIAWLIGDDPLLYIFDPLGHTRYSRKLISKFKSQVGVTPMLIATGIQYDGWRCGYISTWLAIDIYLILKAGCGVPDWNNPRPPPSGWVQFIVRIVQTRDLQDHFDNQFPAHLNLTPLLNECRTSAIFDVQKLLHH